MSVVIFFYFTQLYTLMRKVAFQMFPFLFIGFTALPNRSDGIISKYYKENIVNVASSGSIGQYYENKCQQTYPNQTIFEGDNPKD